MHKNSKPVNIKRDADTSRFAKRIGSVTYEVGIHFNKDAKETMDKKIMRLIKNEMAHTASQSSKHTATTISPHEIHKREAV